MIGLGLQTWRRTSIFSHEIGGRGRRKRRSFCLRHALTREAIYTSLLLRERQSPHRSVAAAIEPHLKITRQLYPFRYPFSPAEVVEFFRTYY